MKNIKWMGAFAATAASTLVAVLCASRGMPAQTAPATRIAVAAVDIDVGQRLAPRLITLIDWPAGKLPPGAFSDPHKLDGRVLRASLLHGEPLTESALQPPGPATVNLHLADLTVPAATRGEASQAEHARRAGLPTFRRDERAGVREFDPETTAWLMLSEEPWAPATPMGAAKPAGA